MRGRCRLLHTVHLPLLRGPDPCLHPFMPSVSTTIISRSAERSRGITMHQQWKASAPAGAACKQPMHAMVHGGRSEEKSIIFSTSKI